MAPRDSTATNTSSSPAGDNSRRPSATEVLTRTLLAVKAGGEARRIGPMTEEDLMALKEEHVAFRARTLECHRRIGELAAAMRALRLKLESQIEQAEEETARFKRGRKK